MAHLDPRLLEGVRLFNREEFFEAHEVVEDLWHDARGGERDLLKGLIQAAVALEHHLRGNLAGLRSVGRTARAHLRPYAPAAGGLDVAGLLAGLGDFLERVERGETPPYPRARLLDGAPKGAGGTR